MSDIAELKRLFEEDRKATNEMVSRLDSLEQKHDAVTQDEVKKIKTDLSGLFDKMDEKSKDIQAEIDAAAERDKRMANLEAKLATTDIRGDGVTEMDKKQLDAFKAYARKGDESGLLELKDMTVGNDPDGGWTVPITMREGIGKRLRRTSAIRNWATVISAHTYEVLWERGQAGFEWVGEAQTRSSTTTPDIVKITIGSHELSALPKVSQRLLDDSAFNVAGFLEESIADRFMRAENAAFVTGDGVNQPRGFLDYSFATTADESRANETIQYVATGVSADFAASQPSDVLATVFYKLQPQYQANATWMMNSDTAAEVASLRDEDGSLLIVSMLNQNGTLLRSIHGRPLELANDMPSTTADAHAIAVGDFSAYHIVDPQQIRVLRDPFSSKPYVLFYTTKRVGGGVVDFDAIKTIKFGS